MKSMGKNVFLRLSEVGNTSKCTNKLKEEKYSIFGLGHNNKFDRFITVRVCLITSKL